MKFNQKIKIQDKIIARNSRVFIIAEAGVNHNGRLDLALKLVDVAVAAGADAVKFQTFKAEQVVTKDGEMASCQKKNLGKVESQRAMLRKLELQENFYQKLGKYVILHPNSSVFGNCRIGDHCELAAGSLLIDKDLKNNCVYFGYPKYFHIRKSHNINQIWS